MNIQLSSRSDDWHTPPHIIDMVVDVLGPIDLDPASSQVANCTVQAERYLSEEQDGLVTPWPYCGALFLNPPGGKVGNRSKAQLFWERLMQHRRNFSQAIFMGFSLEHLQTTQRSEFSILDFPFCVPSKRIRFVGPDGTKNSPSHSNVIAYVPGCLDRTVMFHKVFSSIGRVVIPHVE